MLAVFLGIAHLVLPSLGGCSVPWLLLPQLVSSTNVWQLWAPHGSMLLQGVTKTRRWARKNGYTPASVTLWVPGREVVWGLAGTHKGVSGNGFERKVEWGDKKELLGSWIFSRSPGAGVGVEVCWDGQLKWAGISSYRSDLERLRWMVRRIKVAYLILSQVWWL